MSIPNATYTLDAVWIITLFTVVAPSSDKLPEDCLTADKILEIYCCKDRGFNDVNDNDDDDNDDNAGGAGHVVDDDGANDGVN